MAQESAGKILTFTAGGNITQYRMVAISADWTVTQCDNTADITVGVAQETVSSGGEVSVMVSGVTKVEANASLTAGALVSCSADGQAAAAVGGTGDNVHVVGLMLDSPAEAAALGSMLLVGTSYMIADNS